MVGFCCVTDALIPQGLKLAGVTGHHTAEISNCWEADRTVMQQSVTGRLFWGWVHREGFSEEVTLELTPE